MIQLANEAFAKNFGSPPAHIVHAPGRVNLIGEHTDYNNGFVLPIAIDRGIWIALRPREDKIVKLISLDFSSPADFSLEDISHGGGWADYLHGMAWVLLGMGFSLSGWEGVLVSNIPVASGLSSSAALEMAAARAFWSVSPWDWDPVQMAKSAQKMENEWLHLKSGVMDQMISAGGKSEHALLIDCLDLTSKQIPIPDQVSIVVMDTCVKRGLIDSEYNHRVEECQTAAEYFGIESLRELTIEKLEHEGSALDPVVLRRARHVVTENHRTQLAALAMRNCDISHLAALINASHNSLRDDYQVSCVELDQMVDLALQDPTCLASRMTGAGFGGCAIALLRGKNTEAFIHSTAKAYQDLTGIKPNLFETKASAGAR